MSANPFLHPTQPITVLYLQGPMQYTQYPYTLCVYLHITSIYIKPGTQWVLKWVPEYFFSYAKNPTSISWSCYVRCLFAMVSWCRCVTNVQSSHVMKLPASVMNITCASAQKRYQKVLSQGLVPFGTINHIIYTSIMRDWLLKSIVSISCRPGS